MHLFDTETRLMGGYAIVGGQLPLATGAGLAIRRKGDNDVVVCQMGDATTNIGAFHESLNLAALWKLPVVYAVDQQRVRDGHLGRSGLGESRRSTTRRAPTAFRGSRSTATTSSRCATRHEPRSSTRAPSTSRACSMNIAAIA